MNFHAVSAIYRFEMARTRRTLLQSVVAPVITTSLYFVVFGAAIGSRINQVDGISYGAFIVPGLIMLSLLTQSISNAAFGIYLTAISFSLFGFIIGIWADNFEKLQMIPLLVVTPLVFLGGTFYSVSMLSPVWQMVTLFNPVFYLVSGLRWSFYGQSDVSVWISIGIIMGFLAACLVTVGWIFKTGYHLRN